MVKFHDPLFCFKCVFCAPIGNERISFSCSVTGDKDTEETAKFIRMIDKFFDTLNVSNLVCGKHKRKSFQSPYISSKDFRLKVNSVL